MSALAITSLHLHPVKALRGFSAPLVQLDRFGACGDRRFLVFDSTGRFLTQREHPRMATLGARYDGADALVISDDAGRSVRVPPPDPSTPPSRISATVWRDAVEVDDCGDAAAGFLSDALQIACRLGRMGDVYRRPIRRAPDPLPGHEVSFADAFPLLVLTEASLEELNRRLAARGAAAVPMDRFRPNIVIGGASAFDEDQWAELEVAGARLRLVKPCARCPVVTTDQRTGERSKEPLATLAVFRRDPAQPTLVNFGQNVVNLSLHGTLRVGDEVAIVRRRVSS